MMRSVALAIGLMLLAGTARSSDNLECRKGFLTQSWDLLKMASYGQSPYEQAAFIVRDPSGAERFALWPFGHLASKATYARTLPENAIAIIHTHPNAVPLPSNNDVRLAARLRLPVYVVTRTMIARTDGQGVEILHRGDWQPSSSHAALGRCVAQSRLE